MKKTIAKTISIIFGPIVLWPTTLFIIATKTQLHSVNYKIVSLMLFLLLVVLPFAYIFILYKQSAITDLDLTKRQQRFKPLFFIFIFLIISFVIVHLFGTKLLSDLFVITFVLFLIDLLITMFWKISYHMAINVVATILINYLYNWSFPILYVSIPLVFWSRLYLKKHDVWQLLSALILNGGLTLILLRLFNYV